MNSSLRIWSNQLLPEPARDALERGVRQHTLVFSRSTQPSNLATASSDPELQDIDVAFGQPNPLDVIASERLMWVHLSTAGYANHDREDLREAMRSRGAIMSNSSTIYSEPCAEHVLAMMLAVARRLPEALADQRARRWDYLPLRARSKLLRGQSALIVGFGSIGRRLVQLLEPFQMRIVAVRRSPQGTESVTTVSMQEAEQHFSQADHVVDLLPGGSNTDRFFNAERFASMKSGAIFYNVGRGSTVDQSALIESLQSARLAAAFIDVTAPEPLPPDHPLWSAPNCHITPHSAGGHEREYDRLVEHFLENLKRFIAELPLLDRIA